MASSADMAVCCSKCFNVQSLVYALQERDRRKDMAAQKAVEVEELQKAKLLLRRQSMVSCLCNIATAGAAFLWLVTARLAGCSAVSR